jgi:hypothetical protein
MIEWVKWFFSSSKNSIVKDSSIYIKLLELEEKYSNLLKDVVRLEEENVETTNTLYELMNNIDAVDARIDILTSEKFLENKND